MTGLFSLGDQEAYYEYRDDETAIALAKRVVKIVSQWDLDVGSILRVYDDDGVLIYECRVARPLH